MPLSREMALRGFRQATAEVLTAGVYGAPADIYAVQTHAFNENHTVSVLPGNDVNKDTHSQLIDADATLTCGMDLGTLGQITGNAPVDAGTTPTQTVTMTRNALVQAPYFRLKNRVAYIGQGEAGGYTESFPLCKIVGLSWTLQHGEYVNVQMQLKIIPDPTTGDIYELKKLETDAALSTTADVAAPTVVLTPLDTATGVATSVTPTWDFNEAIQYDETNFSLHLLTSLTDTSVVAGTFAYNSSTFVVTFTPGSALTSTAKYQMNARGVRDLAGNLMAESIGNFTVA